MSSEFKIVIVDDELKIVQLIQRLIDWDNLPLNLVGTAHDGLAALELIEKEQPDIVVLDIRMPGYNGIELISRSKEFNTHIHFIIVSGYRHFEYAHNAIKFGVEDYLLKPVKKEEINRTLRKIICKKQQNNQLAEIKQSNLEQGFLESIFLGDPHVLPSREECNSRFNINLEYENYEVLLLKNDLNSTELNDNEISLLEDKTVSSIKSCFSDNRIPYFFHIGEKGYYFLLNYRDRDQKFVGNYIFNLIESIHSYRDLFINLNATVARSGTFNEFSEVRKKMSDVEILILDRFYRGSGTILEEMPQNESPLKAKDILTGAVRAELVKYIEILDSRSLECSINNIYENLEREKALRGGLIIELIEELISLFYYNMGQFFEISEAQKEKITHLRSVLKNQSFGKMLFSIVADEFRGIIDKQQIERNSRDDKPILETKKYINDHFFMNMTLEEVSDQIGMNPTYLSSLFKKKTGIGFIEYLTQVRIEEAKELLSNPNRSISDTAGEVGYKDAKHFTRQFKKIVGLSPAEYRKIYY